MFLFQWKGKTIDNTEIIYKWWSKEAGMDLIIENVSNDHQYNTWMRTAERQHNVLTAD